MALEKAQDNIVEEQTNSQTDSQTQVDKDTTVKMTTSEKSSTNKPETTTVPVPNAAPAPNNQTRPATSPIFTKSSPNDLYRKLLPAVLFLLTFVTVMTMLLIYMDTVALGAQQFRLNMSRDYELAKIPQDSSSLVLYVRQLHFAPKQSNKGDIQPVSTRSVRELDKVFGEKYSGTFVEVQNSGPRDPSSSYLESSRDWSGAVVRAAPRDFLSVRGHSCALHACLSPADHPREIAYHESSAEAGWFRSRVLCLPLYTILLATETTKADFTLLAGGPIYSALSVLPYEKTSLKVIEIRTSDATMRNQTESLLVSKNYTVIANFEDSVMFKLNTEMSP